MAVLPARIQYNSRYVTDLRSQIGYYIGYIPEYVSDVEDFYEILEHDVEFRHVIELRSIMIAGESYEISGTDSRLNQIVAKALKRIKRFTVARKVLAEKSATYGLAVMKKKWKKEQWPEYPGLTWEVPVEIEEVDRRRMRIERDTEDKNKLYWTVWCPKTDQYMIIADRNEDPGATLAMQDFVWMTHEHEENAAYGGYKGVGEVIYRLAYIKHKTIQYWADLAEHWGQPVVTAAINAAQAAFNAASQTGGAVKDADEVIANWLDLLKNMVARKCFVYPDTDKFEVHEAGSTGNNLLRELIEYIDLKYQLLILGCELVTIAPSVGSYAATQSQKGIYDYIVNFYRANVDECIETDIIYDFFCRNRLNFLQLGIKWPGPDGLNFRSVAKQEEQQAQQQQMDFGDLGA
jgi:hypothetical protein